MIMKRKLIIISVFLVSLFALVFISILSNKRVQVLEIEEAPAPFEVIESVEANDEVFGGGVSSLVAGTIGESKIKKLSFGNVAELTKPKIGYQVAYSDKDSDGNNDHVSIRYTAAINSLSVESATWTRAMYEADGDIYPGLTEDNKGVVTAYTGLSSNGVISYPTNIFDDFGNKPYNYFVVYTLMDIPLAGYAKYYLDASLTLTKGGESVTSTVGALEVDAQASFSYERGTNDDLVFTEKGDKKLSVKGKDKNALSHHEVVIPGYYNNGNGRYKVNEVEEDAFKDFLDLDFLEIPDVDIMGANIVFGSLATLLLRCFNGKDHNNANWHSEWNNGHNKTAWDYVGYHGEKDGIIYAIGKDEHGALFSTAVGYTNEMSDDPTVTAFNGITTTTIGGWAFNGCTSLQSITLPNTIKNIEQGAFRGCTNLQSVTGCTQLEIIGDYAFYNCQQLITFSFNDGLRRIGESAFYFCQYLNDIILPDSLEYAGYFCFQYIWYVNKMYIPSGVENIANAITNNNIVYGTIFYEGSDSLDNMNWTKIVYACEDATEYITSDGVKYAYSLLGGSKHIVITGATNECTDAIIPDEINGYEVTEILPKAFYSKGIETVTIGSNVTAINFQSFSACNQLVSITIPGNVETIGYSAFSQCQNLKNVTIESGVTNLEGAAFYNCQSLKNVYIPATLASMGSQCFEGSAATLYCEALEEPNSWSSDWNNSGCQAYWNYSLSDFLLIID